MGKNVNGGKVWLPDWDHVALNGRDVLIVYDSDVMRKFAVSAALRRLIAHLEGKGAAVRAVYLPHGPNGDKLGVDDWLAVGHTVEELQRLAESPRPAPQATPPTVELLDSPPPVMRRPLALIDGRAYAATWLHTRVTLTESLSRSGEVVLHNPPLIKTESRLFVIRDDGVVFGDGADKPLNGTGLEVRLPETPPAEKLWSTADVKSYRAGARPSPAGVFRRVTDVVDRFIDFDRSIATQEVMAEAVACYCLSTWLLDAFSVIGFIWPSGDRGSGKTHLLLTIAELAYLGQVILAGGSYATLRDLADYGATLAFDDAENLSDPRKTDPDKRALLLAGNRRGTTVTVKELGPDKAWHTRHVNAFCPRLFSAIRLPDPILASRTIIVPLIRTPDRKRANADPLDFSSWPHCRRELVDDLWGLAIAHLPELPRFDEWTAQHARLTGRNLQPWRALLAVAAWLEEHGVRDLWERMSALMLDYQNERPELEIADLTGLVIRALSQCAVSAVCADSAINSQTPPSQWTWATAHIAEVAAQVAIDEETDIAAEDVNARRVGRVLGKMRLKRIRESGRGPRQWIVTRNDLVRWTQSYGIPLADELADPNSLPPNGTNGENGTNGTPYDDVDEV